MKLLISISNYGNGQLNYLKRIIEEFKNYKNYDVNITVHTTENLNIDDINIIKYPPSIKTNLVFKHRKEFVDNIDKYDIFLYTENDMLIKEEAIDTFLKYDSFLPLDYCIGWIRFENRENDKNKYFPDLNPHWGNSISNKNIKINGNEYFSVFNVHQGCWLLTKEKLKTICFTKHFNEENGSLESGASGIFSSQWGGSINKILIKDEKDLNKCLIHHMSNKYCNIQSSEWQNNPGPHTFESLLKTL